MEKEKKYKIPQELELPMFAHHSVRWLSKCCEAPKGSELYRCVQDFSKSLNFPFPLLNPGILMAYAYIEFVYPWEAFKEKRENQNEIARSIDFNNLRVIKKGLNRKKLDDNVYLLSRIRNSISHARFEIEPNLDIVFNDEDKKKEDIFKAKIPCRDFGNLVQEYSQRLMEIKLFSRLEDFRV